MVDVMITKLMPPTYSRERLIERPRLLDLLNKAGGYKLILLIAPAGYGKTTLALQYINRLNGPAVWYQLDSFDNDPAVFVQYLVMGIRQYLPDYGRETLQILAQNDGNIGSSLRLVATSLVNGLAKQAEHGIILVFDDYHLIKEAIIDQLLQEIIEHLPKGITVLIPSRTAPNLTLPRIRVAGELAALGFEELRFNSREIRDFLAQTRQPLSEGDIVDLEMKTAGWPAALCLLNQSVPEISTTLLNRGTEAVYDFLATEILDRQPEPVKNFLLDSSILEVITAEDCDLLRERNDSAAMIENLIQHQLFLIPLEGEKRAYRYHHLFRDFLLNRCLNSRKTELCLRAGRIARSKENWDGAVEYFANAGNEPELIQTLIIAGRQAFLHGRWQTVQRWLGLLSQDKVKGNPWLSLFQAKIEINRGRLEAAQPWIDIAVKDFKNCDERDGLAESQLAQARIFISRGRYQEAEDVLEQAGDYLGNERFDVTLEKALIRFLTGKFKEAEMILLQSLAFAEQLQDDYVTALILEALGNANYLLCNYPKALHYYQKGVELCPDRILPGSFVADYRPGIYQEWGETDQAYEYAERNIAAKEKLGLIDSLPSAYNVMAEILVDRKEYDKAEEYYLRSINLAREKGDLIYLPVNLAYLAQCYYLQGNLAKARSAAEEALQESGRQSGLSPAVCKGIVGFIFVETGDSVYAGQLLRESMVSLEQMGFLITLHYVYGSLAYLHFKHGDWENFAGYAQKTLELSSSKNFVCYLVSLYKIFSPVLRYGLEHGIEVSFVQKILMRVGEKCLDLLSDLAVHPDFQVRLRIVPLLERIRNEKTRSLLQILREDSDPRVKASAAEKNRELTAFYPVGELEPAIRILCLGSLQIFCGTAEITAADWRIAKARDLLLYLAHRGEMVNIYRIFEDLWPDLSQAKAQSIFYSTLYWLRRVLKPEDGRRFVQYHGKRCGLTPECYGTDQQRFENLLTGVLSSTGESEAEQTRLEKAVALYRGDYLQDFDYPWALSLREHLKRQFLEAGIKLAQIQLRRNQYAQVITGLSKLVQKNPLHEEIHRLLMTAYAGSGDRLAAGNQYQILVRLLKKELNLTPEPQTRELYYKLCGSE